MVIDFARVMQKGSRSFSQHPGREKLPSFACTEFRSGKSVDSTGCIHNGWCRQNRADSTVRFVEDR